MSNDQPPRRPSPPPVSGAQPRDLPALALSLLGHGLLAAAAWMLAQRYVPPQPLALLPSVPMVFEPPAPPTAPTAAPTPPAPTPSPPAPAPPAPAPVTAPPPPPPPVEAPPQPAIPPPRPPPPQRRPPPRLAPPRRSPARPPTPAPAPSAPAPSAPVATPPPAAATTAATVVPPQPIAGLARNRPPPYPEVARRRRQEGRVVLRVMVNDAGTPGAVAVQQSSGFPLLDHAAEEAVQNWRFAPARRGGSAVAGIAEVPFNFRLTD